jgi:hypothetical protein
VIDKEQWHAFIEESFPAYISVEHYERNLPTIVCVVQVHNLDDAQRGWGWL